MYVVNTALTKPPKPKIAICIQTAPSLFLWINTEARSDREGQMPIGPSDHGKPLRHDSFLDCSRVTTFQANELNHARDYGCISARLARRIAEFLQESDLAQNAQKNE